MSTCIAGHGYYLNMNGCPDCAPQLGDLAPLPMSTWRRADMLAVGDVIHLALGSHTVTRIQRGLRNPNRVAIYSGENRWELAGSKFVFVAGSIGR